MCAESPFRGFATICGLCCGQVAIGFWVDRAGGDARVRLGRTPVLVDQSVQDRPTQDWSAARFGRSLRWAEIKSEVQPLMVVSDAGITRLMAKLTVNFAPPAAQLAMANRAKAHISEFDVGHRGLISGPEAVVNVILDAIKATT